MFFELKCTAGNEIEYYYFTCSKFPRNPYLALTNGYAPDKMRLVCWDRDASPVELKSIGLIQYLEKKYFKRQNNRVDWEKEY